MFDRRLVVSVTRMKVCSPVVVDLVVVHPDHDPVAGTYSRHPAIVPDAPDGRGCPRAEEDRRAATAHHRRRARPDQSSRDCSAPEGEVRGRGADGARSLLLSLLALRAQTRARTDPAYSPLQMERDYPLSERQRRRGPRPRAVRVGWNGREGVVKASVRVRSAPISLAWA